MDRALIKLLSEKIPEELRLVASGGSEPDGAEFIISGERLLRGNDIIVRTHPRLAAFPRHRHGFVEVMLVLTGKITHRINDKAVTLRAGDIIFLSKHVSHAIDETSEEDLGINLIMSDDFFRALSPELEGTVFSEFLKQNARDGGDAAYLVFGSGERAVENLIENLLFELTSDSPDRHTASRTVSLLLLLLSRRSERLLRHASHAGDKSEQRRIEILSYIKSHYRDGTLLELSEQMGLSVPYLSKLTAKILGESFVHALYRERMERAKELLLGTNMPISAVVHTVGYENDSYFYRCFREYTDMTPLEFRRALGRCKT